MPSFDSSVPAPARMWNYWLGGKDNFAADREAAERVLEVMPTMPLIARAARLFLISAVHQLAAERGVRQFLDIGTGLPTADNTHDVAQRAAPESRIVYVDYDRYKSSCAHAARGLLRISLNCGNVWSGWTGRGSWWLWCRRATL